MQHTMCLTMPAVQKTRKEKIPAMGRNSCFPMKVHQVLEYASVSNMEQVIRWNDDGKAFLLLNQDEFMKHIAPHFFPNQKRYRSFERLLNIWGFERQRSFARNVSCWSNPNFVRDRPELSRHMVRIENKGTKKKVPTGPKSYRYAYAERKLRIPLSLQQQQAALEFFSLRKPRTSENRTEDKDMERLPLKKRVALREKQDIGAKLHSISRTSTPPSPEDVGKPSTIATIAASGQQGEKTRAGPTSLNQCLQTEGPRLAKPQKQNTTSGLQLRLQRWLQQHALRTHQANVVNKGRSTFARTRRRKLPTTKTRFERLDWQLKELQGAVASHASSSASNGKQSKEIFGQQTTSHLDKMRVCQNYFEGIMQGSGLAQNLVHVEGQFDDAPEPILF